MTQAELASAPKGTRFRIFGKKAENDPVSGHARLLARPSYLQLVREEPWLRRIIPALILLFFAGVGLWRGAELFSDKNRLEQNAREGIQLIATLVTERVSNEYDAYQRGLAKIDAEKSDDKKTGKASALASTKPKSPTLSTSSTPNDKLMQEWLYDSMPDVKLAQDYQIFLTDSTGMIVAARPRNEDDMRKTLVDLLGRAQALSTFGASAGVLDITLPDGQSALGAVHHLGGGRGSVTVLRSNEALYAAWRQDVARNVVVFVVMSGIILLIVYAFFSQGARAREADDMYASTLLRMDAALKRSRSGLWDWDLSRGHIYWSQSMYELLGMEPREELLSFAQINDRMHPEDGNLHQHVEALLDSDRHMMDQRFRMRHEAGHWVWFQIRAELTYSSSKRLHLMGVAMDVSEHVARDEKDVMADMRLRDAVDAISEAFVLWDKDSRLVLCNRPYRELHNLRDDETVVGLGYHDIMDRDQPQVIAVEDDSEIQSDALLLDKVPNAPGHARIYKVQLADGRWLQISERRTRDGGFVSVGTDITHLKQQEGRLLDSEQQLIATINDLRTSRQTLEMQAQQLVVLTEQYAKEKDNAEAANRVKSQFLANISHELRTPLNAILGFSEVMKDEIFGAHQTDKYRDYSNDIHSSGSYLLGLIDDILNMSRLEDGEIDLEPEMVDLVPLAQNSLTGSVADAAELRGVKLSDQLPESLTAFADPELVTQVLCNLVDNAVKFTPEGGEVSLLGHQDHTGYATLIIADTGVGIPQDALDNLGHPFEQVQNQFTKTHKGSGLGLSIARRIVCLSGGAMKIRSRIGQGTRVTVKLPLHGPKDTNLNQLTNHKDIRPIVQDTHS